MMVTLLAFIVALGSLIVVHEFGHYLVARWCGVKVLRFSVGFGRPIWTRRSGRDETEWVIAAFPLGGYVKMADEREGEVSAADLPRAFNRQSVYRRFAIVVAGPVANFLLAIALYWLLFMSGVPGIKPVIGPVPTGSQAASAGFAAGDTITRIGSEAVRTWQDARWIFLQRAVQKSVVTVEVRTVQGNATERRLDLSRLTPEDLDSDFLRTLGLSRQRVEIRPVIGSISAGGAAEREGLRAGDEVVGINNQRVETWQELVEAIRASPGRPITLEIRRDGRLLPVLVITPDPVQENDRKIGRIGAGPHVDREALAAQLVEVRYGPLESVAKAVEKTYDTAAFSLKMLGKMIIGEVSLKNLSGPITIADYAGQSAQSGWVSYLLFLALISISLGVLNLLPIPLLDGGHLMYYIAEVFTGRPLQDRVLEVGQHIGIALLFVLMALALYNDIIRLVNG